ncbi:hypothetical protein AOLI_G00283730 [Acnodon oligacanthus]
MARSLFAHCQLPYRKAKGSELRKMSFTLARVGQVFGEIGQCVVVCFSSHNPLLFTPHLSLRREQPSAER